MYGTYNCYECFITDTVRKESATIRAVFPSPNDVMSILVQVIKYLYMVHLVCRMFLIK